MFRARVFVRYWLPVMIWMALIFSASSDPASGRRSSRIIGPLVRWLVPEISPEAEARVVSVVRKGAHVAEYGVLAAFLWRARRGSSREEPNSRWRWNYAWFAFCLAVLYSVTDEIHQAFVPNRAPSAADVCLDALGAAAGLVVIWMIGRWRGRW